MHGAHFLNEILVFLIAAVVVVSIFRRLKVSPILGYLAAGLLIGPHALEFIDNVEGVRTFSELGVIFLMFSIGLKMPIQRLKLLRRYVFGMGTVQVFVTGAFFSGIAHYFINSLESAVFVGVALALSSTAVSMQVLSERGESASRYGRVSFSVLLFQDLIVVILLVLLSSFKAGQGDIAVTLLQALMKTSVALLSIVFIGRVLLRPVYRLVSSFGNQELFVATTLLIILSTGMATAFAGLSMELGAFLAGLLLAETEYKHQVEADIQPYHGLLLGLFFMAMGMNIDLSLLSERFGVVICIITGLVLIKTVILTAAGRFFNLSLAQSLRVALLLGTGGEFVFVLFEPAIESGLITKSFGSLLSLCVAISMVLTPFLAILGKALEDWITANQSEATLAAAEDEVADLAEHVIVAGFGRLGKLMGQVLAQEIIPFVAIDKEMARVSDGRVRGYPVFFGDAKRATVLRTLGIERAKAVIICLDNAGASSRMAMMIRRHFPNVEVCVRLHDRRYEAKLAQAGCVVVMPENIEPSLQLASSALKMIGTPLDQVNQIINQFRDDYAQPMLVEEDEEIEE